MEPAPSVSATKNLISASPSQASALQQQCPVVSEPKDDGERGRRSKLERLEQLLRLARFNGSFAHSAELKGLLGIEQQAVSLWAEQQWGKPVPSDILVTALVLACLPLNFSGERSTWELVAQKATEWLRTQEHEWSCAGVKSLDDFLASAERVRPPAQPAAS